MMMMIMMMMKAFEQEEQFPMGYFFLGGDNCSPASPCFILYVGSSLQLRPHDVTTVTVILSTNCRFRSINQKRMTEN